MPGISIGGCAGVSELERKNSQAAYCTLRAATSCALQAVRCCELKPQPLRAGPSRRQLRHPFSHAASALLTQIGCTYIYVGLAYISLRFTACRLRPLSAVYCRYGGNEYNLDIAENGSRYCDGQLARGQPAAGMGPGL
jgi:hypothetical protein